MCLTSISFSSYKRFAGSETVELAPVTLFVGKNSSGKSSVLKLLPMLEISFSGLLKKSVIKFDNDGVVLGSSFSDIAHNGNSLGLSFGVAFESGLSLSLSLLSMKAEGDVIINEYNASYQGREIRLKLKKQNDAYIYICEKSGKEYALDSFTGFINSQVLEELECSKTLWKEAIKVDYIGPFRQSPMRVYSYRGMESYEKVGIDGSAAYDILYDSVELQEKVSAWYASNFNGTKIDLKSVDKGMYQVRMQKKDTPFFVNIADEGQGMSQVLPIVVRCLMPDDNAIIAVEQPELHLHPAAHLNLATLFARTAKELNHCYLIETHSENLLLGIRNAVVDSNNPLTDKDVLIYFVDEDEDGSAYLRKIEIDREGNLSDWPVGVFNESYEILNDIKNKASKNRTE